MAIDRLINSTQGDSIISALGASGAIATALTTIATNANTPYNLENKLNTQYTNLTGYTKASASEAIVASDNVPTALGKLEYKVDTNTADISTNTTNISSCKNITDRIVMDDTEDTILYVQSTQPTGTIPEGSIWINTAVSNV